jgi:hypothetical protein
MREQNVASFADIPRETKRKEAVEVVEDDRFPALAETKMGQRGSHIS